jgi:hypothetical protein
MFGIVFAPFLLLLADAPPPKHLAADREMLAAIQYIELGLRQGKFTSQDAKYFKFFTTYACPPAIQVDCSYALPFVLNSAARFDYDGVIRRPKKVTGTLYMADIRDWGWDLETWELIYQQQPYFLQPLADDLYYNRLRLLCGNAMFRADWFVYNCSDSTAQLDRGEDNILYYLLLYGKGKEPKSSRDFQKIWGVDAKRIQKFKLGKAAVVNQGESGVSRHTRFILHARTEYGDYWETRDVRSHENGKDFVEDWQAVKYEAAEYITNHRNGLQVYLLSQGNVDQKGKQLGNAFERIDRAAPEIVVNRTDVHDPSVRTPHGCFACHAGINPVSNFFPKFFAKGGKVNFKDKNLYEEFQALYRRKPGIDFEIGQSNERYEIAIKECNGLTPVENIAAFLAVYEYYRESVDFEQAAREVGLPEMVIQERIKASAGGRISSLYYRMPVPRDAWDSVKAGAYAQVVLLIKRIDPQDLPALKQQVIVTSNEAYLQARGYNSVYIPLGTKLPYVKHYSDEWIQVLYKEEKWFILSKNVEVRYE